VTWQIPKPSECESPNLWKGCVGLWVPALGPTGGTLRDLSGYGKHGTLTNMDPATDWILGEKGWAIDFDGLNDEIKCPGRIFTPPSKRTYSTWIYVIDPQPSTFAGRIVSERTSFGGFFFTQDTNTFGFIHSGSTNLDVRATDNSYTLNTWVHLSATWMGGVSAADVHLYVNGRETSYKTRVNGVSLKDADGNGLRIGKEATTSTDTVLKSRIASLTIHNRVLSPAEILDLYREPPASCGGMLTRRRRIFAASVAAPPATNRRRRLLLGSCA